MALAVVTVLLVDIGNMSYSFTFSLSLLKSYYGKAELRRGV